MKKVAKSTFVLAFTLFSVGSVLLVPRPVFAFTRGYTLPTSFPTITLNPSIKPTITAIKGHLQGAKLAACEANYQTIVANANKAIQQANAMYQTLTYSAEATETYYKTESAITHKTLPNYNALVQAVQTTGFAVPPLIQVTQNDITAFNCNAANPSEQVEQFGKDTTSLVNALVAYQTAVSNLMLAVENLFALPTVTP